MELGLKRGMVTLEPHNDEWVIAAEEMIMKLKNILSTDAVDIQHVGSTAIRGIPAKPIIDIAIAVRDFQSVYEHQKQLERAGLIFRGENVPGDLLLVIGPQEARTHHIHVVIWNGVEWNNYLNFRDYLNTHPAMAERYAARKQELAAAHPTDRGAYTNGKQQLIVEFLKLAAEWRCEKR